jgi:hypothetical protein
VSESHSQSVSQTIPGVVLFALFALTFILHSLLIPSSEGDVTFTYVPFVPFFATTMDDGPQPVAISDLA